MSQATCLCAHIDFGIFRSAEAPSFLLDSGNCLYAHLHRGRDRRRRSRTRLARAGEAERDRLRARLAPTTSDVPRVASNIHEDLPRACPVLRVEDQRRSFALCTWFVLDCVGLHTATSQHQLIAPRRRISQSTATRRGSSKRKPLRSS